MHTLPDSRIDYDYSSSYLLMPTAFESKQGTLQGSLSSAYVLYSWSRI